MPLSIVQFVRLTRLRLDALQGCCGEIEAYLLTKQVLALEAILEHDIRLLMLRDRDRRNPFAHARLKGYGSGA